MLFNICLVWSDLSFSFQYISAYPMVLLIYIGYKSNYFSFDPDLAYQSVRHQFLSQSNVNIFYCSIKIVDSRAISTLYRWRCAWDSAINNIYVSMQIWTCPILLLHWINSRKILWWIPIKYIWYENLLTLKDFSSVGGCVTIPQVDYSIVIENPW